MSNALSVGDGMSIMERAISASKSTIVPELYQRNPDNCVIAINLADAMGLNVLTVMQYLYIVHKKPAWAAVFAISRWNTCGKFSPIRYELTGTPGQPKSSCVAVSKDIETGEELRGTVITWDMVVGEEWTKNSKWRNMPEQMFRYRAASFLIKTYAPELLMGLPFADEREDAEVNQKPKGRKLLSELRNVESEVVNELPAIEGPQVSEEVQIAFDKAIQGLGRATEPKHIKWFDENITGAVLDSWTREMQIKFAMKKLEAIDRIKETPEQQFRRCLAEIETKDAKAALEHIKENFDTTDWTMEMSLQMDDAIKAKATK